jgi:hypothetical protein
MIGPLAPQQALGLFAALVLAWRFWVLWRTL